MPKTCLPLLILFALASPRVGLGQVVVYEADSVFPESASPMWERVGTFDATRALADGVLVIDVDFGVWAPPPYGEQDFYKRSLAAFQGAPFFVQWRCRSDAPNTEIEGVGGCAINSWGGAVAYHFTITEDLVRFRRDNFIPFVDIPITIGAFHTYRVECSGADLYSLYVDGQLVDSGVPEADFPNSSANIIWGASVYETPSINEWQYVRHGTIPVDASGDFDGDNDVDETDLHFFLECLTGPDYDAAGPGCRWGDLNVDGVCDGGDIRQFVEAMIGP